MSTVVEIEAAIEKLPADEFTKLLSWLDEYRVMIGVADDLFLSYEEEERKDGKR